jgi:hypothetical protein
MESLRCGVEPFGIRAAIVELSFLRAVGGFLNHLGGAVLEAYVERTTATKAAWRSMNGRQPGDRAKLARTLLELTQHEQPPLRFVSGGEAVPPAEAKAREPAGPGGSLA